ncbi:MAG: HD domain-containing protein, partial [Bacteroidota bacterium]
AHYGSAMFKQSEAGITQIYVIPLQLREVRPKMMDIPEMEVGGMGQPLQDVLPEETALLERLRQETQVDMDLVEKAIGAIKKYHASVKRKSGEPFYLHPIAATDILLSYCTDPEAILAALLHDTVEDTVFTLAEMGVVFGTGVAAIVNKVTHLDGQLHRVKMDTLENLQQLLEEQDKRVLQVKLADRLHNMRTIGGHPSLQKQKKVAAETLQFFVPIARYLGIEEVTKELLALCDAVLQTEAQ